MALPELKAAISRRFPNLDDVDCALFSIIVAAYKAMSDAGQRAVDTKTTKHVCGAVGFSVGEGHHCHACATRKA